MGDGEYHGLFLHKRVEGLCAFFDALAAAVAVVGKSNNRRAKFLAVDSDFEGKENNDQS